MCLDSNSVLMAKLLCQIDELAEAFYACQNFLLIHSCDRRIVDSSCIRHYLTQPGEEP